jgi:protein-arginine kinase activator protein McsA
MKQELKNPSKKMLVRGCSLEKLEKMLKDTINDENFEMAAILRDAIAIKNENIRNYGKKKKR